MVVVGGDCWAYGEEGEEDAVKYERRLSVFGPFDVLLRGETNLRERNRDDGVDLMFDADLEPLLPLPGNVSLRL